MTYRAMFDGTCSADCSQRVHRGDPIVYVDGHLYHTACAPETQPERGVCHDCWHDPCRCN